MVGIKGRINEVEDGIRDFLNWVSIGEKKRSGKKRGEVRIVIKEKESGKGREIEIVIGGVIGGRGIMGVIGIDIEIVIMIGIIDGSEGMVNLDSDDID